MQLDKFLDGYPNVLFSDIGDEIFIVYRLLFHGMCSHRLAKLLNFACRFLDENEYYLEVGTYAGFTILSASYESGKQFVGVDNFSENFSVSGKVQDKLQENLDRFPGAHSIINSDFRKFDLAGIGKANPEASIPKIGVFLIDAKHTYEDVVNAISWAKPYFADQAIVIFDDIAIDGVMKAVKEIRQDPHFEEICFANSFYDGKCDRGMSSDPYIHNGFSIMTYKKEVTNA